MSFLVIGGLLAIGVLALVVAVFLGLGGQPEQATANASVAGAPAMGGPAIASVPQAVPPTIPLTPFSPTGTLTNNQTAVPGTHPSSSLPPLPLEGQLHEMVVELRTLHQESHDIEHRLSTLREIAEHIEQNYRSRIGSFDEHPTHPEM